MSKRRVFNRVALLAVCVAFLSTLLMPAAVVSAETDSSSNTVDISCDFDNVYVNVAESTNGIVNVRFTSGELTVKMGETELPKKTVKVILPRNTEIDSIDLELASPVVFNNVAVQDVQELYTMANYAKAEGDLTYSSAKVAVADALSTTSAMTASADSLYPLSNKSEPMIQYKNGIAIAFFDVYPMQYSAEANELVYYDSIDVKVNLKESATKTEVVTRKDLFVTESDYENVSALGTYGSSTPSGSSKLLTGNYDYVVITNGAMRAQFNRLVNHKKSKGLTAASVLIADIYANYAGSNQPTKIRNFIKDVYANNGTKYILLGGDADRTGAIVPALQAWGDGVNSDYSREIATDVYYSCLDGTYNYDGDSYWGEQTDGTGGGMVDLLSEVYVGRAPCDDATEAKNFVDKTIAYEKAVKGKKFHMVGEELDSETYGSSYKNEIRDGSSNYITTPGLPSTYTVDTLYDTSSYSFSGAEAVAVFNSANLINHLGHGSNNWVLKNTSSSTSGLTNAQPFVLYTQACYSGSFDNYNSSMSNVSDCVVEDLIVQENGAVATIANTRYGWYSRGSTNGPSQLFDRTFWDDAMNDHKTKGFAEVLQLSREDVVSYANSDGYYKWVYFEATLLGDPETNMHKRVTTTPVVNSVTVDKATGVTGDKFVFTVKTTSGVTGIKVKLNGVVQSGFYTKKEVNGDVVTWTMSKVITQSGSYTYRFEAKNKATTYKLKKVTVTAPKGKALRVTNITVSPTPVYANKPLTVSWKHNMIGATYDVELYKAGKFVKKFVTTSKQVTIPSTYLKTTGTYQVKISARKAEYNPGDKITKSFTATTEPARVISVGATKTTGNTGEVYAFYVKTSKSVTGLTVKYAGKVQTGFNIKKVDKGDYYLWTVSKKMNVAGTFTYRFEAKNRPASYKLKKITVSAPNGRAAAPTFVRFTPTTFYTGEKLTVKFNSVVPNATHTIKLYRGTRLIKTFNTKNKEYLISGLLLKTAGTYSVKITTNSPGYSTSAITTKPFTLRVQPATPACTNLKCSKYLYEDYFNGNYYDYVYMISYSHSVAAAEFMFKMDSWSSYMDAGTWKEFNLYSNSNYTRFYVYATRTGWKNSPVRSVGVVYRGAASASELEAIKKIESEGRICTDMLNDD